MMSKDYMTPWQKVIFRNYGTVKTSLIGKVIGLSEKDVVLNAEKLGVKNIKYEPLWREKGFVTIIRNNWDILSLDEIAEILEMSESELSKLLEEYDFLSVKLGNKPDVGDNGYRALTKEEEENTERVRKIVEGSYIDRQVAPFDFFGKYVSPVYTPADGEGRIADRFLSSYCAKYSGSLLDDELSDYSDDYLIKLAATGTNGIWLSDTLRNLAEFPFDKSLSSGYEVRIGNLRKLTERCRRHGINVYLYLNEPRSLPESFFDSYPELKGQKVGDGTYCLCTSSEKVKKYVYNAIKSIAEAVPLLYAVMTITMSENPTNCYSRNWGERGGIYTDCPLCKKKKPQEVVSDLNNVIEKALSDGNGYTRLIANVWGWANFASEDRREVFEGIDLLDGEIDVLCVSEYGKEFERGGVSGKVDDYSISVDGPSEFAEKVLKYAKKKGHRIWAKIQVNDSWELSATPYIPVFPLMTDHVLRLKKIGVDGLMLGWSLGGYPGGALPLINSLCDDENTDTKAWYKAVYKEDADAAINAVQAFSKAFKNYPFSVDGIYFGAHNMACGNMWNLQKDERQSTMVCFTFDDVEKWTSPYGVDIYISLLSSLCNGWKEGLEILKNTGEGDAIKELKNCAELSYIHLKSALNLASFSKYKGDKRNKEILKQLISDEYGLTEDLYKLAMTDAKVGFEMTNHYYYNENLLLEKLVNLKGIEYDLENSDF
ncbi:MAG: hypothetical protein J6N93_01215 [Clostridia bacterium]|nr:hypothetical protein [Clostridia bacterium]